MGVCFREETTLAKDWEEYWKGHGGSEIRPVNSRGVLGIGWPKTVLGRDVEFDVILATAAKDTREDAVTPQNVADGWIARGHEYYFFNNVQHGIRTAEDAKIWSHIKDKAPCWVDYQKYSGAVEMLCALTAG